jgi:iron complex transport system permease protein
VSVQTVITGTGVRRRRREAVLAVLGILILLVFAVTLMVGNSFYGPTEVIRVILGETVPGASFTVGEMRLPRATMGLLAGFAFGIAGVTFQTMLRNPLASPDIIGISSGASVAAGVGQIVLSLDDTGVSFLALGGALVTAAAIYLLSHRGGFAGTRLILIGIGVAAMLDSAVTYILSRAAAWDLQTAMQWLTGSLNGATWSGVLPLAFASAVLVPLVLSQGRGLGMLRLGDDAAAGLGVHVTRTRVLLIVSAVALLAFATAACGPIAFVAFMAGPIASRIIGPDASPLLPAGLVGALLVLLADLVGQFAFDSRYPVGVITGAIGAPFLVFLLIRINRSGGSL